MRILIFILGVSIFYAWGQYPDCSEVITVKRVAARAPSIYDLMWPRITWVETKNQADVVGDGGMSWGIAQIQAGVIKDVNRVWDKDYSHEDAFDPEKAREIFELYLEIYRKDWMNDEELARIWNGGPDGWKKKSTDKYIREYKKTRA